jgi:hypothetical protein
MRCTCQSELCHRPSESTGSVNSCIEGNCPFVICPTQSDTLSARLVFFFSSGISHPEALSLSIDWSLSSRRHRVLPSRRVELALIRCRRCGCLVNAWSSRLVYCFGKRKAAKLSGVNAALPIQEEGQTVLLAVQSIDINGG